MYIGLHVKYALFLSDLNENLFFWTDLKKNIQISNRVKISPLGAKLFHADGQTHRQMDR